MHIAHWTLTDEERSIEYDVSLRYMVDDGEFAMKVLCLTYVTNHFYSADHPIRYRVSEASQGVIIEWISRQLRDCDATRKSAEAACRLDCQKHLKILCEQSQEIFTK